MRNAVNAQNLPPLLNGISQAGQCRLRLSPVNASIGDTDTVLQSSLALLGDLLIAYESG